MDEEEIQYQLKLVGSSEQAQVMLSTSDIEAGEVVLMMFRAMIAIGWGPYAIINGTQEALETFREVYSIKDWREKVQ